MNDQALLDALRDVNPIPDPEQLLIDEPEEGAFFATVQTARSIGPVAPQVPRPRGHWFAAVGAAAAALVLLGGAALLFQATGSETPVAGTVVPTTLTESTPTTLSASTPTTLPGEIGQRWYNGLVGGQAVLGGEGGLDIFGVTVGGPGLVAVGATGGWIGDGDAAVWTSPDGITWTRIPHDETVFGGAKSQTMWDVTAGGPGLVAVGWDGQRILDDTPDVDAAIWTSVDGVTWSRVPHDEEVFGGAWITSVTVGGPGLVAVGGTDGYWTDGDAVVWTSVNGITWSRVPHDETIFGGANSQVINDVTIGGPGLVAVGQDGGIGPWDNNLDTNAAVWTSPDGITWSRVPHDETVFGTGGNPSMLSVTAGGPGLVAVGADYWPPELAETPVWTSPDGITWTRVPDDVTVRGSMYVSAGGPGLLVAVGEPVAAAPGGAGVPTPTVWTSVDGITWSRVPATMTQSSVGWVVRVTISGQHFVVVGGPGLVAVGSDGGDAADEVVTEQD